MNNDILGLLFIAVVLIVVIYIFIRIAIRLRKYGGSLTTTMFGATYEFLNKDRKEAVKEIVEMKANKKMEEQRNDKLKEDE
jgi:predicted Holliday junction resolvase-like endonuclease